MYETVFSVWTLAEMLTNDIFLFQKVGKLGMKIFNNERKVTLIYLRIQNIIKGSEESLRITLSKGKFNRYITLNIPNIKYPNLIHNMIS